MIWKIFFFFEDYIDTFNQRKIDIEIKWNNAKQITNQNVEKYAIYFDNLKINLNINESTSKLKLFKNLNDNFRNFVIFDNASTTRYKIFVKILTNEHFFSRNLTKINLKKTRKTIFENEKIETNRNFNVMIVDLKKFRSKTINNRTINNSTSQHFKIIRKKIVEIVKTTTNSIVKKN